MNRKKILKIQKEIETISKFAASVNLQDRDLAFFFFLSNDLLVITGADGYSNFCNKNFLELMGYDESEMKNRDLRDFLHTDDLARSAEIRGGLEPGQTLNHHISRLKKADGNYVKIVWNVIKVENGTMYACGRVVEEPNESK